MSKRALQPRRYLLHCSSGIFYGACNSSSCGEDTLKPRQKLLDVRTLASAGVRTHLNHARSPDVSIRWREDTLKPRQKLLDVWTSASAGVGPADARDLEDVGFTFGIHCFLLFYLKFL